MEHFDVLTPDGQLTGQSKPRADVHRDGDWHRSVHVWIINDQHELLIQKRSANKDTNPNLWDVSAAGHLSAGEVSLEAAVKEVGEELGQVISAADLEFLFTVTTPCHYPVMNVLDNEFQDVYLLRRNIPLPDFVVQVEEVSDLKYISIPELECQIAEKSPNFVRHDEEYQRLFKLLRARSI